MSAQVFDYAPAAFRRTLDRQQPGGEVSPCTILEDVADGILALDFALTFAGFGYEARQLVLSVVGLLGGSGGTLEAFDGELADHLQCSDRTVRRWRSAHLKESSRVRFSLLEINEGEYDATQQRYEKTSYRFTSPDYVAAVLRDARASDLYQSDRRAAIERAAEEHYGDIPDAPPRRRSRKPRRAPAVRVERAFINAARSVEKGKQALGELGEDSREALLQSMQGEELRQTLLKLHADVAEILENFPQASDGEEVDEGVGHFVRYPPPCPAPLHDRQDEARAEDAAAWQEIERRAAGAPRVVTREVPLRSPSDLVEDLEAEAIRAEGCRELR